MRWLGTLRPPERGRCVATSSPASRWLPISCSRGPDAALAAVVVYPGLRLIDVKELARIARYRRTRLLIALATTSGVLVLGVLQGVVVSVSSRSGVPGLLVYRYDAPLFFANADNFLSRVRESVATYDPEWVLLNAEAMGEVDLTGADALETLRAELAANGIVLALARLKQEPREVLQPSGLLERIGDEHIFPTLPTALEGYCAATGRE